jgi:RNA polymerase sigma factor (sigma-70 family)
MDKLPHIPDDELVAWLCSADEALQNRALQVLYREHRNKLCHWMINRGAEEEQSLDIFQESMLALYDQVREGKFEGKSSLGSYLGGICRFKWLNANRRSGGDNDSLEGKENLLSEMPSIEDTMEQSEQRAKIHRCLDLLGPDCRTILTLFYLEERSLKEIQQAMNLQSVAYTKVKKSRCLKTLIKKLGGHDKEEQ